MMARYPSCSRSIKLRQAKLMDAAFNHACRIGCKPNYHLSVQWRLTQHEDAPFKALQKLLESLRKWLARRGIPEVFIWVRERVRDQCEHAHIALHCPSRFAADLSTAIWRWIGEPDDGRAFDLTPCLENMNCNARTLVTGYFLKGGNQAVRENFPKANSSRHSHCQGTLDGKRVGVSRTLGARAIANYFGRPLRASAPENISNKIKAGFQVSQQISIQCDDAA